jgi:hypothetical protein
MLRVFLASMIAAGCGDDSSAPDGGARDGGTRDSGVRGDSGSVDSGSTDAGRDAGSSDAGTDAGPSCIDEGHPAGKRYRLDACNVCVCNEDGTSTCSDRECLGTFEGCEYAGAMHAYGERFPSTDTCNECVCAASGLACTRRTECEPNDEGAILVESLDTPCGTDPEFTAQSVLNDLPTSIDTRLLYRREPPYGETLPDTDLSIHFFVEGFVVCRLPSEDQPAFDIEVLADWVSADGAFDEGLHGYVRKNGFGFVDAVLVEGVAPPGGLDGTYSPGCPDPGTFGFFAQIELDGSSHGYILKICEADTALDVGTFGRAP